MDQATVDPRRRVPRTDVVLADPRLVAAADRLGRAPVKAAVAAAQQRARAGELDPDRVVEAAVAALPDTAGGLRPVLNATGVVLHTNLGRAAAVRPPRSTRVVAAAGHTDVELDLGTGRRARRGRTALAALAAAVPGRGRRARGQQRRRGAGAGRDRAGRRPGDRGQPGRAGRDRRRVPAARPAGVAPARGCARWAPPTAPSLADYAAAVGPDTGFILKVHPSNFVVRGFTTAVGVAELAGARAAGGRRTSAPGCSRRTRCCPTSRTRRPRCGPGRALVTASGDKLLGGPQAGLLLGDAAIVERLRRHPLARALRVDKLTLAALEATLAGPETPTWRALRTDPGVLRARSERAARGDRRGRGRRRAGRVGRGGRWRRRARSSSCRRGRCPCRRGTPQPLRAGDPPVLGRVERGRLLLDLRCVPPDADAGGAAPRCRRGGSLTCTSSPPPGTSTTASPPWSGR